MADTATATKPAGEKATASSVVKPERPDEEAFKVKLAAAEKELKASEEKLRALKAQIDSASPNNKDSPSGKRQAELREELKGIRTQQQSSKTGRSSVMDKIKRLDETLKAQIAESKNARSKTVYKSADEVQQAINKLQAQVDTGSMKIVDEKKALGDISQLNRLKKGFAGFDDSQKRIDETKAQIAELRKQLDDPESRAQSDRYTQITTELDKIKAEQDESYKSLNSLRDARSKAHEDQQKKWANVKEIKDAHFSQKRAAREYDQEARRIREEKRRAENDAYHRGRRQEAAKAKLEDASAPAYEDEIRSARSLLAHFDPSSVTKQEVAGPGKFAAEPSRKIDDAPIKGTALKKKGEEEENYFIGGGGKKKRSRKQAGDSAAFNLDFDIITSLTRFDIDPPTSQADVPRVVEKLKEKLEFWNGDRDRKTKENVAKAEAEIQRLEAEAAEADAGHSTDSRKPAGKVNGSATAGAEKDTVDDATADLEKAKIEDNTAA